jgi:hypothetical protein
MRAAQLVQSCICLLIVGTLAGGCGRPPKDADAAPARVEEGVSFNENKGLSIPKSTADFIGLKIVDVEEQKLASTFRFNAKVYRPSAISAESRPTLASGFVAKADAQQLQGGQNVKIETEENFALTGKIAALNREMEKINGKVEVLLQIDDPQKSLALESFVEAVIPIETDEITVGVPRAALLRTAEGDFVYTVSGEHLVRSKVEVGDFSNEVVEVRDGLYAGDQVVANPVMTLWMAELQSIRGGASCADGH